MIVWYFYHWKNDFLRFRHGSVIGKFQFCRTVYFCLDLEFVPLFYDTGPGNTTPHLWLKFKYRISNFDLKKNILLLFDRRDLQFNANKLTKNRRHYPLLNIETMTPSRSRTMDASEASSCSTFFYCVTLSWVRDHHVRAFFSIFLINFYFSLSKGF